MWHCFCLLSLSPVGDVDCSCSGQPWSLGGVILQTKPWRGTVMVFFFFGLNGFDVSKWLEVWFLGHSGDVLTYISNHVLHSLCKSLFVLLWCHTTPGPNIHKSSHQNFYFLLKAQVKSGLNWSVSVSGGGDFHPVLVPLVQPSKPWLHTLPHRWQVWIHPPCVS